LISLGLSSVPSERQKAPTIILRQISSGKAGFLLEFLLGHVEYGNAI